jgi:hypothetical protein
LDKTVGADGKTRKLPAKKKPAPVDGDAESSAQARKDHYAAAEDDGSLEEKIFSGAPFTETDVKEWRKRERERMKEALPEGEDDERVTLGDYFDLHKRARKLEDRNKELSAALNAKEAEASRDWPADMTPRQLKRRDDCLKQIAAWQRQLEQLYGEVTGTPSYCADPQIDRRALHGALLRLRRGYARSSRWRRAEKL